MKPARIFRVREIPVRSRNSSSDNDLNRGLDFRQLRYIAIVRYHHHNGGYYCLSGNQSERDGGFVR
jgi:hypothetical protein